MARSNFHQLWDAADVTAPFLKFLTEFLPPDHQPEIMIKHFPSTLEELVNETLESVMAIVNSQREISASKKNKLAVIELYKRGMFKITGAIDLVAKTMGISRYTVYNYMRKAKGDTAFTGVVREE